MGSTAPKKARAAAGEKGPSERGHLCFRPHPTNRTSHQPQDHRKRAYTTSKPPRICPVLREIKLQKGRPESQGKEHYSDTVEAQTPKEIQPRGPLGSPAWVRAAAFSKSLHQAFTGSPALVNLSAFSSLACNPAVHRACSWDSVSGSSED